VAGDNVVTELDGGLVTVTPGAVSEETSVSSEDVDLPAPGDEVTTVAPITTTILSIEETDEEVTIVTTMMPMESMTTTARPEDDMEDTTRAEDEAATTVRAESDTTTPAIDVDGETVEDLTTPKTEVTTVMTDSESDTITIMVGSETDSETTTAKSALESSTTAKSEVEEATDVLEDAGVRADVEVDSEEEEAETTTAKAEAEIEEEDENDMAENADGTTPRTDAEEDAVEDGEGRTMLEGTTTLQPGDEDVTSPKAESETTVPSVGQEEIPETEVTAVPIDADEDVEMTTLSQSPPSLGPTSEDTQSSGEPELEVTSSPVDEDTPSVPEEGVITTIMPDAVVTLLTTVRPRAQDEDQTEQPEDVEDDTIDAAEEEKPEEEGTTLAPEDAGMHEFDCSEFTDAELAFADPNQIPLQCRLRPKEGGEPKTVYILIPKQGLDLTRLFDKNVKVVVKDLMIMDISPK